MYSARNDDALTKYAHLEKLVCRKRQNSLFLFVSYNFTVFDVIYLKSFCFCIFLLKF